MISEAGFKPTTHEIPKETYQIRQYANAMIALFKRYYNSLPDDHPAREIAQTQCGHVFSKISSTSLPLQDYIDFSRFLHMDVMNPRSELNKLCNLRAVCVADDDPVLLACDQQNFMLQNFKELSLAACKKFPRLRDDPFLHQWTDVKVHFIARKWLDHLTQHIYQLTSENNRARQNSLLINCPSGIPQLIKERYGFWIHKNYLSIAFPTQEEKQEEAALNYFMYTIRDMIGNMQAIDKIYKIAVEYSYRRRHPFWDAVAGKKFTQTQNNDMAFLKLLFFELAKTTCKRIIVVSKFDRSFGYCQTRELREIVKNAFLIDHHRCARWSPARLTMTNLRRAIEQRMRFNGSPALATMKYIPMPSKQHIGVYPEKLQMKIDNGLDRDSYIDALTEPDGPGGYSSGLPLQTQKDHAEKYWDYTTHLKDFPTAKSNREANEMTGGL